MTWFLSFLYSDPRRNPEDIISIREVEHSTGARCLKTILPCQQLLKPGCTVGRGKIGSDFTPAPQLNDPIQLESLELNYTTWVTLRYLTKDNFILNTPSYSAINSVKSEFISELSVISYTPVIPHPATEIDTFYTTMKNFQDVLIQKQFPYGPLWSDEGVYRLAKELQLLLPGEFNNIFLGLGGFLLMFISKTRQLRNVGTISTKLMKMLLLLLSSLLFPKIVIFSNKKTF